MLAFGTAPVLIIATTAAVPLYRTLSRHLQFAQASRLSRFFFGEDLACGPFQFLFSTRNKDDRSNGLLPLLLDQLSDLRIIAESQNEESIIITTIDKLIACSREVQSRPQPTTPPEPACIYVWPMQTTPLFLDLVAGRDPAALAVVAHYCLLIHWGGTRWCFEGCFDSLMQEISSELRGTSWEGALEWTVNMAAET